MSQLHLRGRAVCSAVMVGLAGVQPVWQAPTVGSFGGGRCTVFSTWTKRARTRVICKAYLLGETFGKAVIWQG